MITQQSIKDRITEMSRLDATNCSSEVAIARYIIKELDGYRVGSKYYNEDIEFIACAIQAYAKMLQDANLKIGE